MLGNQQRVDVIQPAFAQTNVRDNLVWFSFQRVSLFLSNGFLNNQTLIFLFLKKLKKQFWKFFMTLRFI